MLLKHILKKHIDLSADTARYQSILSNDYLISTLLLRRVYRTQDLALKTLEYNNELFQTPIRTTNCAFRTVEINCEKKRSNLQIDGAAGDKPVNP